MPQCVRRAIQNNSVKELKRMHTRLVKLLKEDTPEAVRISL